MKSITQNYRFPSVDSSLNLDRWRFLNPESLELFLEDLTFSPSYDLAPLHPFSPLLSASCLSSSCVSPVELTNGREGDRKIIRRRERLALYKSFQLSDFTYQPQSSVACLFAPAVCRPSALLSPHRLPLNDQSIWINK
jgi:hypothetical protein